MAVKIDTEKCTGCGICVEVCLQEAIKVGDIAEVDGEKCTDCGTCAEECPNEAITITE